MQESRVSLFKQFILPRMAAMESHGRTRMSYPHFHPIAKLPLCLRRWYANSALRALLGELYAFRRRIRWVLQIREAEIHCRPEKVRDWMDTCAVSEPYTRDYSAYMQGVWDRHPFLSIFDSLLLTEAWNSGAESGARVNISHSQVKGANS